MTTIHSGTRGFGWCLILAGLCFISRAVTAFLTGPPPSVGTDILAWIDSARFTMMLGNEALVIGAGLLLAGFYGFQQAFIGKAPMKTTAGSALLFAGCVVCLVLGIVQGRFVYPIYGIALVRPDEAELLVSIYFGGYHLVALAFAAATTFWSLAMLRATGWLRLGFLGFPIAIGSVISSYPDLVGSLWVLVLESALALWWIGIGYQLLGGATIDMRTDNAVA